nr:hypothetical protein [Tanacetum cinerariifolium]
NHPAFYDDDDDDDDVDYTIAITPVLSIEKPIDSLNMGDEHLDTIPATGSDEVIKSSVEELVSIPSESEGIPEHKCDVPFHDNSPPLDVSKDQFEDFSESNDVFSSTDNVSSSPPDSELVSSEVMEIVIPEISGGNTTTHSDISLSEYDSFTFDLSNDQFPPSDRSDFTDEEFADELSHIISPPEYDCF